MSDNCEVRVMNGEQDDNPFFKILSRLILQAWATRDAMAEQTDPPEVPPRIVSCPCFEALLQRTPCAEARKGDEL